MSKNKILKLFFSLVIFLLLGIIQLGAFTPYTRTETYISVQNVPHTIVAARGWKNADNIGYTYKDKNGTIERERINISIALLQLILTLALPIVICFDSDIKELLNKKSNDDTIAILKDQNKQFQEAVNNLIEENKTLSQYKNKKGEIEQ